MHVERVHSDAFVVNQLPDGSRVIHDTTTDKLYALNPTAGAAWDACSDPTTLENVTQTMQRSFDPKITDEIAEEAILQLKDHNLVNTAESPTLGSRRRFLAALGAAAVPLVVSLTAKDQLAYAENAKSGKEKKEHKEKKEDE